MSIKILFEQIESGPAQVLSDCDLQSIAIRRDNYDDAAAAHKKVFYRSAQTGTDVTCVEKSCGPSCLKMNVATTYEFQRLNATQIHRAINDPKLTEFLNRVYPLLKEELDDSNLFNKL